MPGAVSFLWDLIVVVGGWLGEDLMELCTSCCNVGYVRDGFPDEIG